MPSKPKPLLQASKWLDVQLLIDELEMQDLLTKLEDFGIYLTGSIVPRGQGEVSHETFLKSYNAYVKSLREGVLPQSTGYRALFSTLWTVNADALSIADIGETESIIRASQPVVQLRPHQMAYSPVDGKIRSMVLGPESVSWGIQFSYPQIYQDPETLEIKQIFKGSEFPNTTLFKALQKWVRYETIPTPFVAEGKKINSPIRIGKRCLSWINQHPQLRSGLLQVSQE